MCQQAQRQRWPAWGQVAIEQGFEHVLRAHLCSLSDLGRELAPPLHQRHLVIGQKTIAQ